MTAHQQGRSVRRGLTAALLAVLVLLTGASAATAVSVPTQFDVTMSFTDLLPGQTQTQSALLVLPFRARVSDVLLREEGPVGAVIWQAQLCTDGAPCLDLLTGQGHEDVLTAGAHRLVVTATRATLEAGQVSTLIGRVSVVRADPLATTGSDAAVSLAMLALALTASGALLVALVRRHRPDDDEPPEEVATC